MSPQTQNNQGKIENNIDQGNFQIFQYNLSKIDQYDEPFANIKEIDCQYPEQLHSTQLQEENIYKDSSIWQKFQNGDSDGDGEEDFLKDKIDEIQMFSKVGINSEPSQVSDKRLYQEQSLNGISKQHAINTNRTQCKNFLPLCKRCLYKLSAQYPQNLAISNALAMIGDKKNTNKKDFEEIFSQQELKQFLAQIFLSKKLIRQMIQSRVGKKNRLHFLREINLIKKAFLNGELNNL